MSQDSEWKNQPAHVTKVKSLGEWKVGNIALNVLH